MLNLFILNDLIIVKLLIIIMYFDKMFVGNLFYYFYA